MRYAPQRTLDVLFVFAIISIIGIVASLVMSYDIEKSLEDVDIQWLDDPNYCKDQGGFWNGTTRGCYGLYDMCEKDGGIPRFLKNSLPFPDIEENKPTEYLMDCYYASGQIEDIDYFREIKNEN